MEQYSDMFVGDSLQHLAIKAGTRRPSTETVEMDASSSVISGNSESSSPIKCRRRVLDVADILDLNCDVVSIDSHLVGQVCRATFIRRTSADVLN